MVDKNPKSRFYCWLWPTLICVTLVITIYVICCYWPSAVTTVYLVRHAEYDDIDNESLTSDGLQRAQDLANLLRSAELDAVYSTEKCRTSQTAQPTVQENGLNLYVMKLSGAAVDFNNCLPLIQVQTQVIDASIDHAATIANHILTNHEGEVVLVVGHSNTVPRIVSALEAESLCPDLGPLEDNGECHLPDSQFDNLFIVTICGNGNANTVRLRYGEMTP